MTENSKEDVKITAEHLAYPPMPETSAGKAEQGDATEEPLDLNTAKVGFIVALKEDGKIVFQPFGTNQDIVSLMGIQEYAAKRVNTAVERTLATGDGLVHEVGMAINAVHQKLDGLSGFLMSKEAPTEIPEKKPE